MTTAHKLAGAPHCPNCGTLLDGVTAISGDDAPPTTGDLSICIGCATPLTFSSPTSLRLATEDDFKHLTLTAVFALSRLQQIVLSSLQQRIGPVPTDD